MIFPCKKIYPLALFLHTLFFFPAFSPCLFAKQRVSGPLAISSSEFGYGMRMPLETAQHSGNRLPTLIITGIPPGTQSFAIEMVDPSTSSGVWIHWLAANIPPSTRTLKADTLPEEIVIGTNDFGNSHYDGPLPPSGTRHYLFHVFALDTVLTLKPGFSYRKLESAMWGHILQKATLMGTFSTNL